MAFEEALPYVAVAVGAVVVTALTMYTMMGRRKKTAGPIVLPKTSSEASTRWTFRAEHTVSSEEAHQAREQLRILELEREILSDAIRRLYEAQVEGKITEQERDRLAEEYKSKMLRVKDAIGKSQSVVALQELEAMQEDLVKLFDERFDDLNMKVEEMRSKVQTIPEREEPEIPVTIEAPEEIETSADEETETEETTSEQRQAKRKKPKPKTPSTPGKTEAEKRIDQIRAEVEKVLERLGQMEVET